MCENNNQFSGDFRLEYHFSGSSGRLLSLWYMVSIMDLEAMDPEAMDLEDMDLEDMGPKVTVAPVSE